MILNEVNFFSETLGLLSSMYVLLPQRTLADLFSGKSSFDSRSPVKPSVNVVDALFGLVDRHTRAMLATQLESLSQLQQHPVLLISPVMIDVR